MYRRFTSAIFVLLPCLSANADEARQQNSKPNVLFIAVDDLKPALGCYGDRYAVTPNIDSLAGRSAVFTSCYCQQAVSAASRASLLTGVRPDSTKVWDLKTLIRDMNPDILTLPEYFRANGYETAGTGKIYDGRSVDRKQDSLSWSLPYLDFRKFQEPYYRKHSFGSYVAPETVESGMRYIREAEEKGIKGYARIAYAMKYVKPSVESENVPDNAYPDGAIADCAIDYLENRGGAHTPFFLAVGFQKPHLPFCSPSVYWEMHDRESAPLAGFRRRAAGSPALANHRSNELLSYSDIPPAYSFSDIDNTVIDIPKQKELIHGYYAAVSYIDAQIGRILGTLDSLGLRGNTIIVLWGDHGWHLGDHGLWNKHSNFENAVHVPFMVSIPGAAPSRLTAPVEFLDIFPTLCEAAGLDIPDGLDGDSLLGNIMEGTEPDTEYAVSQWPGGAGTMGYSLRTSRYRYTVWFGWKGRYPDMEDVRAEELYDYYTDPEETANLVGDCRYGKVLDRMRSLFEEYRYSKLK